MSLTNGGGRVECPLRCATIGRRSRHRVYGQPSGAVDVPNHCDGCDGRGSGDEYMVS
jgi:hypothetical protein